MRIVIDINHPAHVHYFRNFISSMEQEGHKVLVTAIDKDVALQLLNAYGIDFIKLGTHAKTRIGKILSIFLINLKMFYTVRSFRPDIFMGFGSFRAAQVSWVLRKPSIIFDDTEAGVWEQRLYRPFASRIITPDWFRKDFGKKHTKFHGHIELAYLHPSRFVPDRRVIQEEGLGKEELFILVRLVSWSAGHDQGQTGIKDPIRLVKGLSTIARVIISAEGELPEELELFRMKTSPNHFHDLLSCSVLYIGEGATVATEAALLGIHAIYVNTISLPYIETEYPTANMVSWISGGDQDDAILTEAKRIIHQFQEVNAGDDKSIDMDDITDLMKKSVYQFFS